MPLVRGPMSENVEDYWGSRDLIKRFQKSYKDHPNLVLEPYLGNNYITFDINLFINEKKIYYILNTINTNLKHKNNRSIFKMGFGNCYEHQQDEYRSYIYPYTKTVITLVNLIKDDVRFTRQITNYEFISSTYIS